MIANTSYYNNNKGVDLDNDNMIDVDNELLPFVSILLSQIESDPWYPFRMSILPLAPLVHCGFTLAYGLTGV